MHTLLDEFVSFGGSVGHIACNLIMLAAGAEVNLEPRSNQRDYTSLSTLTLKVAGNCNG